MSTLTTDSIASELLEETLLTLEQITTGDTVLAINASRQPEQSPRVRQLLGELLEALQEAEKVLGTYASAQSLCQIYFWTLCFVFQEGAVLCGLSGSDSPGSWPPCTSSSQSLTMPWMVAIAKFWPACRERGFCIWAGLPSASELLCLVLWI